MTQFYSRIDTIFNGDVYSIPFSYINKDDISVYINDELYSKWYFLNASQIKLTEIPDDLPIDSIISIRRSTNINEKIIDYSNNTMLVKEALNTSQDQLLNAIQEVYDNTAQFEIDTLNSQENYKTEVRAIIQQVSDAADKINAFEEAVEEAKNHADNAALSKNIAAEQVELAKNKVLEIEATGEQIIIDATEEVEKANTTLNKAYEVVDEIIQEADTKVEDLLLKIDNIGMPSFCANSGNVDGNGHADLLYAPNSSIVRQYFTLPNFTSNSYKGYTITGKGNVQGGAYYYFFRDYNVTNNTSFRINKHQGTIYVQVKFPEGKTAFINKIYTPKVSYDLGYGMPSTTKWQVIMYKGGQQVYSNTFSGLNKNIAISAVEVDTIRITNIVSNNPDWVANSAFKFEGYEVIENLTETNCFFKVGNDYDKLVLTNASNETFEKNGLQPIDVSSSPNGVHTVYVPKQGEPYMLKGSVYRQSTTPLDVAKDTIWLNTGFKPLLAKKYNGESWEDFNDVPIGVITVENGIIKTVETFAYNLTEDGGWVNKFFDICANVSIGKTQEITYDLSEYLPNDNCAYEVIGYVTGTTAATNGYGSDIYIYNDLMALVRILGLITRTNSTVTGVGNFMCPISPKRYITIGNYSNPTTLGFFRLVAYRRLGAYK